MRTSQQQNSETQVMTFAGGKDKQWIQVGVSDLTGHSAEIISTERVEQMHLPAAFVQRHALGDCARDDGAGDAGERQRELDRSAGDRPRRR